MPTSKVTYQDNLRTQAIHLRSGNTIISDAPVDNRGKGEAFSPTDLMATSVASCMITIMGIRAADKGWDITGATAEVTKIMGTNPRRVVRIEIDLQMPDNGFSEKDRKLLEAAARGCPVVESIHPDIEIDLTFQW